MQVGGASEERLSVPQPVACHTDAPALLWTPRVCGLRLEYPLRVDASSGNAALVGHARNSAPSAATGGKALLPTAPSCWRAARRLASAPSVRNTVMVRDFSPCSAPKEAALQECSYAHPEQSCVWRAHMALMPVFQGCTACECGTRRAPGVEQMPSKLPQHAVLSTAHSGERARRQLHPPQTCSCITSLCSAPGR